MGNYTPPARNAIELQYVGNYTPPARDAIALGYPTPPSVPTGLEVAGQTNPTDVSTLSFTAIYHDPNSDNFAIQAQVQVATDSAFSDIVWDSGAVNIGTDTTVGSRTPPIAGPDLDLNGRKYFWRIRLKDNIGLWGAWSVEEAYFYMHQNPPTNFEVVDLDTTSIQVQCDDHPWLIYKWFIKTAADGTWSLVETTTTGQYTFDGLVQGNHYWIAVASYNPDIDLLGDKAEKNLWTYYMLNVTEVRDQDDNLLEGALVVVLSEEDALAGVSQSAEGQDLPALGILRANLTDVNGACNIKLPGGKGKVAVFFVYPDDTIGGDIRVHIATKDT